MPEHRHVPPPPPHRRYVSMGAVPLHTPNSPSRLRESMANSPTQETDFPQRLQTSGQSSEYQSSQHHLPSETSSPTTAEAKSLRDSDGEDGQAHGTLIEPTAHEEDERTALLEHYHHNRVCGLRNCNHGTFSPRAPSIMSTTNESIAESDLHKYPMSGEHEQPRSFAHGIFGDPIGDALMGTGKKRKKYLPSQESLFKNRKFMYVAYYLPCIRWIIQYQWRWLRGDLTAALTMASFYIPMSLSYATNLGHIPAINGLYSFAIHPLIYAILGTCPQMAVGPEAPGSLLVGTVVATCIDRGHLSDDDDTVQAQIAGVVTATAGAIIFIAGLTRLGFLDSVLSRPFLRGFISAVGIMLFISQAIPELGLSSRLTAAGLDHSSTVAKLVFLIKNIQYSHGLTAAVSWTSWAVIMVTRELKRRLQPRYPGVAYFPDRFLVVLITTILAWKLDWGSQGVALTGRVSAPGSGPFTFHWPFQFQHMVHINTALSTSLIIALLGFFESSVAAKSLGEGTSGLKGVDVSANRELIALGTANLVGGCFMSLPAFGGYGRSKVNVSTGGTTPMSSALLATISILCAYFALPAFYYIPKGVLSAMISVVAFSLIEEAPHDIMFFVRIRGWSELSLMIIICLATLFYSLTVGIALGIGLSLLQIVRHATKPRIQILARVPGQSNKFDNAENFDDDVEDIEHIEGCLIVKIPEPMTFANTGALKNRLRRFEKYGTTKAHPSQPRLRNESSNKNIIFDIHGVTSIDGSGTQVLLEIVEAYHKRGARVVFCRLPQRRSHVYKRLESSGIVELVGGKRHFVGSIDEALKLAEAEDLEMYFDGREGPQHN